MTRRAWYAAEALKAKDLKKLAFHAEDLDAIDLQLLSALQADSKTPLARLGERVGMSPPSVMERVRKLEQAGVITGYRALLDARRLGLDVSAFIGVGISTPECIETFEAWVDDTADVLECHHVTGPHTLLLKVKCRNTRALEHLIRRIQRLEGVVRTETTVVLSTHSERTQVPLDPAILRDGHDRRRGGRRRGARDEADGD